MKNLNEFYTVTAYFEAQPEKTKQKLLELKEIILKVVPNAEELFNYNIPAYTLIEGGKREHQIMIAGYEKFVGFYPHPTSMEKFDTELKAFKKGKGSVQFSLDKPLPKDLIKRMIQFRLKLLME